MSPGAVAAAIDPEARSAQQEIALPPPYAIPDWRRLVRAASQAGPGHACLSRGWVEIIPDWRRLHTIGAHWRRVNGPPIPRDVVRSRRFPAIPTPLPLHPRSSQIGVSLTHACPCSHSHRYDPWALPLASIRHHPGSSAVSSPALRVLSVLCGKGSWCWF